MKVNKTHRTSHYCSTWQLAATIAARSLSVSLSFPAPLLLAGDHMVSYTKGGNPYSSRRHVSNTSCRMGPATRSPLKEKFYKSYKLVKNFKLPELFTDTRQTISHNIVYSLNVANLQVILLQE